MLVGNPADWVIQRERSARRHAARRERLREDRRGLQPHLLASASSRSCAASSARAPPTTSCARSSSSSPRGARRAQPRRAGHRSPTGAISPRTSRRRSPSSSRRVADVPRPALGARSSTSTRRRSTTRSSSSSRSHPRVVPYVDMPLQHAADAMLKRMRRGHGGKTASARRRAPAQGASRASPSAPRSSSATPARPTPTSRSSATSCAWARVRPRRRLPLLRRGDVARASTLDGKVPRKTAHAGTAADGLQRRIARRRTALSWARARRPRRGPERRARVRDGRPPRGAGARDRRPGLPLRRRGAAGADPPRAITQASDYDLVGDVTDDADEAPQAMPEAPALVHRASDGRRVVLRTVS